VSPRLCLIGVRAVPILGLRSAGALEAEKRPRLSLDRPIQRIVDLQRSARSAGPYRHALLGSTIPGAS